jgi:hypothetical protein
MTLLSHLGHPLPRSPLDLLHRPARPAPARQQATAGPLDLDPRVFAVQRLGAVGVGLVLLVFGLLGATGGVGFLSSTGERYLGMSTNGLLSVLSLAVAAILLGAALRGPRTASTVMMVLGVLFLLSALVNMALIGTAANLLAFQLGNVAFSVVVGLLLLLLGAYGRFSGALPANSPYAHPRDLHEEPSDLPGTPEEVAAEAAMREAEIAVVQHYATDEQRRRVRAMAAARTRDGRRRVWMELDGTAAEPR